MWLRLTPGHTRDRAKLASTLHACSVSLAAVARKKMVGLSPPSAIPPRGSSLLATLGGGAHTVFSAGVPNECNNHIYGRQRNHIYGLCLWCSLTTSLSERRKWAQRRTGETAIHQSLGSLLQNKINGEETGSAARCVCVTGNHAIRP